MMMAEADFLTTIAELAIALIAFATIVVAIRQMVGGGLDAFQFLVVKLFTVCGFAALLFGLLPIVLAFFAVPSEWVWRVCNPLLAATGLSIHIWYFRNRKRVAPTRRMNATNYLNLTFMSAAIILLILGALGIAFENSIAPYAFALVCLLIAAATAFLQTLADFIGPSD